MKKESVATGKAPKAIGPYSQAVKAGGFVFISGQIPFDPAGGTLAAGDIRVQARRTLDNLKAVAEASGSCLDKAVKVTVYLKDMADFEAVNEVYADYFQPPYPARAAVQAAALPKGVPLEIDAILIA